MPMLNPFRRQQTDTPKPSLRERIAAATGRRASRTASPSDVPAAPASPFDDPATVAWFSSSGLVPFPAAAPQSFVSAETAIRMEAGLLLERARAEFGRQYAEQSDHLPGPKWPGMLAGRLERMLRIPELEAAARDPMCPDPALVTGWGDADDEALQGYLAEVCRLDGKIAALHAVSGEGGHVDELPQYRALSARRAEFIESVIETGAQGLSGLQAKARLIRHLSQPLLLQSDLQSEVANSLADDLQRLRPAAVVGRLDPIHAVIAKGRRLLAAVEAAALLPLEEGSVDPRPEHIAALEALDEHRTELLGFSPETAAGCLALARYAAEFARSQGIPLGREEGSLDLLELMADCPEGQGTSSHRSPALDDGPPATDGEA